MLIYEKRETSCEFVILWYGDSVKNITIALDDETYRRARIIAAQRDASVSGLVKKYLTSLSADGAAPPRNLKEEQESLLDSIRARHARFSAAENFSRDEVHERHAVH